MLTRAPRVIIPLSNTQKAYQLTEYICPLQDQIVVYVIWTRSMINHWSNLLGASRDKVKLFFPCSNNENIIFKT